MIIFNNNLPVEINSQEEFDNFAKDYRIIHAAGGIVSNENDEILMIYRLEKWDFPKGKVEAGEQYDEAAIREVEEETGLRNITLGETLPSTFHTYELRGEQILKETHWYKMNALSQSLTPQTIEDITQAVWIPRNEVAEKMKASYASLERLWEEIR
ncbi:MAG: NUDIX domain-containing protein [Bacteroidales bacterium]|nr:NUDIX domain-containing protein [Bacteroidales bacterium]